MLAFPVMVLLAHVSKDVDNEFDGNGLVWVRNNEINTSAPFNNYQEMASTILSPTIIPLGRALLTELLRFYLGIVSFCSGLRIQCVDWEVNILVSLCPTGTGPTLKTLLLCSPTLSPLLAIARVWAQKMGDVLARVTPFKASLTEETVLVDLLTPLLSVYLLLRQWLINCKATSIPLSAHA
jgi:hypothetical protein